MKMKKCKPAPDKGRVAHEKREVKVLKRLMKEDEKAIKKAKGKGKK